ncbi:hypothetical protein GBA52_027199 [Prunus armeniaca]|nr:hypothetical protein GBA52_027199 [Prunus armeniaca]
MRSKDKIAYFYDGTLLSPPPTLTPHPSKTFSVSLCFIIPFGFSLIMDYSFSSNI